MEGKTLAIRILVLLPYYVKIYRTTTKLNYLFMCREFIYISRTRDSRHASGEKLIRRLSNADFSFRIRSKIRMNVEVDIFRFYCDSIWKNAIQ